MPKHPAIPPAAKPTRPQFDPWNSSSTGHQRAENRLAGSTSWRDSRTAKLREQFGDRSGGGGRRVFDSVGAGSKDFGKDGRRENGSWEKGASGLRQGGQRSILEAFAVRKPTSGTSSESKKDAARVGHSFAAGSQLQSDPRPTANGSQSSNVELSDGKSRTKIFQGLVFYINGSTYPTISDYKLKQLIGLHGGTLSIALGRRTVTHVIVGKANAGPGKGSGCGGGLASSKIQKELATIRGQGVKFVRAEWLVDCIKQGKRVSEVGYGGLDMTRVGSVVGHLQR